MTSQPISFYVDGSPVPQPRAKPWFNKKTSRLHHYTPKRAPVTQWKESIYNQAKKHKPSTVPLCGAAVGLQFSLQRPKAHYGTGKNKDTLKKSAPNFHTQRPDTDNLAKAVLDVMQELGYWKDDSQVYHLSVTKSWCGSVFQPGCRVEVQYFPEE